MSLRAITVCVDYADLLQRSLERWHLGADRLVVITAPHDDRTIALCHRLRVETHVTDIFYRNGARFNKGAAMSECIHHKGLRRPDDWLLTFDSDIVPPVNWRPALEGYEPRPGRLYGAYRYWQPEDADRLEVDRARRMPQSWVLGFFSLCHFSDSRLRHPVFDMCWPHAGNYDTTFCRQWPKSHQVLLPIPMIHLGEERSNWVGRGSREELQRDFLSKREGWEGWQHERMENPPTLGD